MDREASFCSCSMRMACSNPPEFRQVFFTRGQFSNRFLHFSGRLDTVESKREGCVMQLNRHDEVVRAC